MYAMALRVTQEHENLLRGWAGADPAGATARKSTS